MLTADPPDALDYIPRASYQLSVLVLLSEADRNGVAFALHGAYTALGHRRGGTTVADEQLAEILGVSADTVRRKRKVIVDCDTLTEAPRGRQVLRRTKHPEEFICVPGAAMRLLVQGQITPLEFRVLAYIIHRRAERGMAAGCALTRAELARGLGIRPDAIGSSIARLKALSLLHVQTRAGTGWILTPKWMKPNQRSISWTARREMAERRRRWNLPRYGTRSTASSPAATAPAQATVTPLRFAGQPPLSFAGQPGVAGAASAQVSQHLVTGSIGTMGFERHSGSLEVTDPARNLTALARSERPWARKLLAHLDSLPPQSPLPVAASGRF